MAEAKADDLSAFMAGKLLELRACSFLRLGAAEQSAVAVDELLAFLSPLPIEDREPLNLSWCVELLMAAGDPRRVVRRCAPALTEIMELARFTSVARKLTEFARAGET